LGVLPAAGRATRIAPLPCSKELLPVGLRAEQGLGGSPKVVCHYLLEKMHLAGIRYAYIILRRGKWDIPAYLTDGTLVGLHLAYLVTPPTPGVPYTVDQAYPFTKDALVVFGFPDILFQPPDVYSRLLAQHASTKGDVVLALFPAHDPAEMDMVDTDFRGRAQSILLKPPTTHLRFAWICAVWTPVFTHFLREHLLHDREQLISAGATCNGSEPGELSLGAVFQAAIEHGLAVDTVAFPDGSYVDIGTPQGLRKALHYGS
jgi:glucose-1-phosphate thymidylyltransferase